MNANDIEFSLVQACLHNAINGNDSGKKLVSRLESAISNALDKSNTFIKSVNNLVAASEEMLKLHDDGQCTCQTCYRLRNAITGVKELLAGHEEAPVKSLSPWTDGLRGVIKNK